MCSLEDIRPEPRLTTDPPLKSPYTVRRHSPLLVGFPWLSGFLAVVHTICTSPGDPGHGDDRNPKA